MTPDRVQARDLDPTRTSVDTGAGGSSLSAPGGAAASAPIPTTVGPYRILGLLGEGGMGRVYEAEQATPKRRVALKVINAAKAMSQQHLHMFEREIETLARLKHPNIAAIYESGKTDDGQHYFAMELVRGPLLNEAVTGPLAGRADLERRLTLFRAVCDAVQYAHQRGVIHRDLKPTNIVVTEEAGVAAVKVLDFGLARLAGSEVMATITTHKDQIQGTLSYMSPEQAQGRPDDVDVRSDVYSLGMILYEMLAGRRPYDLKDRSIAEALAAIVNERPRPLAESAPRGLKVDADLDTVARKSLEKDPERRYQSAAALADDLGRYLASQPILARPPSAAYLLRKAIERNRLASVLAAALVVLIVAGVAWMGVLYARAGRARLDAERQARIAGAVNDFLNDDLLAAVDPTRTPDRDITMRTVLETAAKKIDAGFRGEPLVAAAVRRTLGRTFAGIGELDEANKHLEAALEIYKQEGGADSIDALRTEVDLAGVAYNAGRPEECETILRRTIERLRRTAGPDSVDTVNALTQLSAALYDQGKLEEAEKEARAALEAGRRGPGETALETLTAMNNLAMIDTDLGKMEEAEAFYLKLIDQYRSTDQEEMPFLLQTLGNLAQLYVAQGRLEEAEKVAEDTLARHRRVLGSEHNLTLTAINNLAIIERRLKHYDRAESLYKEAYETSRRTLGEDSLSTLLPMMNLARFYAATGRCADERASIDAAIARMRQSAPPDSPLVATAYRVEGECRVARGDLAGAEAPLVESEARLTKLFPGDTGRLNELRGEIADLYERLGRPAKAAEWRARATPSEAEPAPAPSPTSEAAPNPPAQ
ncbi:MAG TPA: serine/threonine-protein kinase [Candidatus Polarisedimenticolia bacterium]|nr:serine/threonine-protein kinase [Candidatus Polarisedimenticolia bacterium]